MEKSQLPMRWLVLFLSCTLMIGNYYCFDNPSALKSQLQQRFSHLPNDRYEFLFVCSHVWILLYPFFLEYAVHIVLNPKYNFALLRWILGRSIGHSSDVVHGKKKCVYHG